MKKSCYGDGYVSGIGGRVVALMPDIHGTCAGPVLDQCQDLPEPDPQPEFEAVPDKVTVMAVNQELRTEIEVWARERYPVFF